jgi:hypothetical protein
MKNLLFLNILFLAFFFFPACNGDDDSGEIIPEYHVHIHSPNVDAKNVGDEIDIEVEFEEHNGGTVHHINVRVYNKDTGEEIYNQPTQAHVHATAGYYEFMDKLTLNVASNTHWVLEAKVWGHDDGVAEVVEKLEFHVN